MRRRCRSRPPAPRRSRAPPCPSVAFVRPSPAPCATSTRLPHLRRKLVIDLTRALRRRTRAQKIPITLERGPLVDRAEHHAESDMRPDISVRGGEAIACNVLGAVELIFERGERLVA